MRKLALTLNAKEIRLQVKADTYITGQIDKSSDMVKNAALAYNEQAGDEAYHEVKLYRIMKGAVSKFEANMAEYVETSNSQASITNTLSKETLSDSSDGEFNINLSVGARFNGAFANTITALAQEFIINMMLYAWWQSIKPTLAKDYFNVAQESLENVRRCLSKTAPSSSLASYSDVHGSISDDSNGDNNSGSGDTGGDNNGGDNNGGGEQNPNPLNPSDTDPRVPVTITLNKESYKTYTGEDTEQIVASTTPAGLLLSFQSSNSGIATVDSGGYIEGIAAGTCIITVSFAGNSQYKPATKTVNVTVGAAREELNLAFIIENNTWSGTYVEGGPNNTPQIELDIPEGAVNKTFIWSASPTGIVNLTPAQQGQTHTMLIVPLSTGTVTIAAEFAGDDDYKPADVQHTFTVSAGSNSQQENNNPSDPGNQTVNPGDNNGGNANPSDPTPTPSEGTSNTFNASSPILKDGYRGFTIPKEVILDAQSLEIAYNGSASNLTINRYTTAEDESDYFMSTESGGSTIDIGNSNPFTVDAAMLANLKAMSGAGRYCIYSSAIGSNDTLTITGVYASGWTLPEGADAAYTGPIKETHTYTINASQDSNSKWGFVIPSETLLATCEGNYLYTGNLDPVSLELYRLTTVSDNDYTDNAQSGTPIMTMLQSSGFITAGNLTAINAASGVGSFVVVPSGNGVLTSTDTLTLELTINVSQSTGNETVTPEPSNEQNPNTPS